MRASLFILIAAATLVVIYNTPSCGTARVCGAPAHDVLHWIAGR